MTDKAHILSIVPVLMITLSAVAPATTQVPPKPPAVPPPAVIASQETNTQGVVAELIECRRKEGVLSIRVRLRSTGSGAVDYPIYRRDFGNYYVTAENKKYFMLKDSEGAWLATPPNPQDNLDAHIAAGQTFVWWAKFPAPPPAVKKINLVMPGVAPFEDVPVTDQQ